MASRRLLGLALLSCLVSGLLGGCDDEVLETLDAEALVERFACDDLTIVAADAAGDRALLLGIDDGLAAEVIAEGRVIEADYVLPDPRLTVRWVEGSNVYQGQCGRDSGQPWRIEARHDAIEGEIAMRLEPLADGRIAVTAEIDDLLLTAEGAGAGAGASAEASEDEHEPAYVLAPTRIEGLLLPPGA